MEVKSINNNINFKQGLNKFIENEVHHADVGKIEKYLANTYNIDAKFKNHKSIASCIRFTADIFQEAIDKYRLPFEHRPPCIRTFKPKDWKMFQPGDENIMGFCIDIKQSTLMRDKEFLPCSLFFRRIDDDISLIDSNIENDYKEKYSCSPHFLVHFIHEWAHNIHVNKIYSRHNFNSDTIKNDDNIEKVINELDKYENNCPKFLKALIIKQNLSNYANYNYMELFAETISKIFTDALNPGYPILSKNPMDNLKSLPRFLQKFIEEQLT